MTPVLDVFWCFCVLFGLFSSSNTLPTDTVPASHEQVSVITTEALLARGHKSTGLSPKQSASPPYWKPAAGTTWQIELTGPVSDTSYAAAVFDIDLFETPASKISLLHSLNKKVICYFSAGSLETWRPDASSFQSSDKGSPLVGWQNEWWLNTRSANVRAIMRARIVLAKSKGCDGVDPDNVDGYDNANGLGLTQATAIDYMTFLANEAHSRGMSIGLKNAGDIVGAVLPIMDWEVNEQCLDVGDNGGECGLFTPFINAGKPVFHIEYPSDAPSISAETKSAYCGNPTAKGFSTVLKNMELDAWVVAC